MTRAFVLRISFLVVLAFRSSVVRGQDGASAAVDQRLASLAELKTTAEEQATIRSLIEQLVMSDEPAANQPMRAPPVAQFPDARAFANGAPAKPDVDAQQAADYRKGFEACQTAFRKLAELKMAAFPLLVEHLDDNRQSINFRNHSLGNSVGDACRWNIYYQLVDTPENYSQYGYGRPGRDGKDHPRPAWDGTPFDAAGGLRQWLEANKSLTYPAMQIKCLQWFLEKEKAIGARDAESYFITILPLEVRILERRREAGEDVGDELARLRQALASKNASVIPPELLPPK